MTHVQNEFVTRTWDLLVWYYTGCDQKLTSIVTGAMKISKRRMDVCNRDNVLITRWSTSDLFFRNRSQGQFRMCVNGIDHIGTDLVS